MYILLTKENTVAEIIPDENPVFPNVPIEKRYTSEFVSKLLHFPDDTVVEQNWIYHSDTKSFSAPVALTPEQEEQVLV